MLRDSTLKKLLILKYFMDIKIIFISTYMRNGFPKYALLQNMKDELHVQVTSASRIITCEAPSVDHRLVGACADALIRLKTRWRSTFT